MQQKAETKLTSCSLNISGYTSFVLRYESNWKDIADDEALIRIFVVACKICGTDNMHWFTNYILYANR